MRSILTLSQGWFIFARINIKTNSSEIIVNNILYKLIVDLVNLTEKKIVLYFPRVVARFPIFSKINLFNYFKIEGRPCILDIQLLIWERMPGFIWKSERKFRPGGL